MPIAELVAGEEESYTIKEADEDSDDSSGSSGYVAANFDYYLVSEKWYFFLQLQTGPTDLFLVVPRNDAIFPKLHTNQY